MPPREATVGSVMTLKDPPGSTGQPSTLGAAVSRLVIPVAGFVRALKLAPPSVDASISITDTASVDTT
jgi:hypothetical protein